MFHQKLHSSVERYSLNRARTSARLDSEVDINGNKSESYGDHGNTATQDMCSQTKVSYEILSFVAVQTEGRFGSMPVEISNVLGTSSDKNAIVKDYQYTGM